MNMNTSWDQFLLQFYHYQHFIFEQAHLNALCDHVLKLQWRPHMRWIHLHNCDTNCVTILTLGLRLSVQCKGLWGQESLFNITNGGECKGWSLMTLKCTPTLGVAFVWELQMFKTLVGKEKRHQIGPPWHH